MPKEPFRTPFLKRPSDIAASHNYDSSESDTKKRRISDEHKPPKVDKVSPLTSEVPSISSLPRKALSEVKNSIVPAGLGQPATQGTHSYYNVLW